MKRFIMAIVIVLLLSCSAFAAFRKSSSLEIAGFYDEVFNVTLTNLLDSSDWPDPNGINLNYNDTGNKNNTYLIAPTNVPLTRPGLKIGTFDVMVSFNASYSGRTSAHITITHDKLCHDTMPEVQFDYELAVHYDINDGNTLTSDITKICQSTTSTLGGPKSIEIPIVPYNPNAGLCTIKSGGMFFRLSIDDPVNVDGTYTSTIKFELESN
ncbi:MAG: hypothetical protein MJ057_05935 [Sphaerochaetaceae bacterium]|nr:hypothetical protein [Sphaerochaetaceae bacterium]